jgi:hypothetical protein
MWYYGFFPQNFKKSKIFPELINRFVKKETIFRNSEGEISATKLFVNFFLFASFFFSVIFLWRDFSSGIELNEHHIILILTFLAFGLISKELARRLLVKLKSFEISSDGLKISFEEEEEEKDSEFPNKDPLE